MNLLRAHSVPGVILAYSGPDALHSVEEFTERVDWGRRRRGIDTGMLQGSQALDSRIVSCMVC